MSKTLYPSVFFKINFLLDTPTPNMNLVQFRNLIPIFNGSWNSTRLIIDPVEDSKPASFGVRIYYIYSHDKGKQLLFPVFSAQQVWRIYWPQSRTLSINILRDNPLLTGTPRYKGSGECRLLMKTVLMTLTQKSILLSQ